MTEETIEEIEINSPEDLADTLVPGLLKEEYQKIRKKALEEAKARKHAWVLKGRGKLVCTSCEYPHTAFIDPNLKLTGIDENGNPIFDKNILGNL